MSSLFFVLLKCVQFIVPTSIKPKTTIVPLKSMYTKNEQKYPVKKSNFSFAYPLFASILHQSLYYFLHSYTILQNAKYNKYVHRK